MANAAIRWHLSSGALTDYAETRGVYGWPCIWKTLLGRGIRVGKERIQKLMKLRGIRAKGKRRFKVSANSQLRLPTTKGRMAFSTGLESRGQVPPLTNRTRLGPLPVQVMQVRDQTPSQGRSYRLATLVNSARMHSTLAYVSQLDAVRAKLACGSAQASQFMISVMGYGIQGQGQDAPSPNNVGGKTVRQFELTLIWFKR
jgi:hypothetical protein